jgi:iron complex outermembrane recepter protein
MHNSAIYKLYKKGASIRKMLPLMLVTPMVGHLSGQEQANAERPTTSSEEILEKMEASHPNTETLPTTVVEAEGDKRDFRLTNSTATGFRATIVKDIPFSVSSFSSDFIQDIQARTVLDVTRNDPSVTPAESSLWYDRVNVRGFYLSTDAVFRDGFGINDQGTIALDNKEAIEITKGLASTRQGITSPGGTLNYVLKRPLNEPLTQVNTFADEFGGFGASTDLSRRFGKDGQFGARFNFAAENIETYLDGVEGERAFASLAFDWRVNERLQLEFETEYQDKEMTTVGTLATWAFPSEADARALLPRLGPESITSQPWAVEPNEQFYYSGRATFDISENWKIRIGAQRSELSRDQRGISASNIQANGDYSIDYYYAPDQDRNNTVYNAILEGDFTTGSIKHELALGYDFIRRDMTYGDAFFGTIGAGNLFNDLVLPAEPNPAVGASFLQFRSNQHSIFLTDTAKFSDWLEVFGGARLTRLQNLSGTAPGVTNETYDKDVVTPTFGVVVKPMSDLSLYTSYAEGIEQGGTAPATTVNANEVFDPLMSEQIEFGAKWELAEGALLTLAVFDVTRQNY